MKQVVTTFILKDNSILLIRKKNNARWLPPGGHVEEGETLWKAIKRELKEELHILNPKWYRSQAPIETSIATPVFCETFINNEGEEKLHVQFLATIEEETIILQEEELDEYKWFSLDDLNDVEERVQEKILCVKELYNKHHKSFA